MFFFYILHHIFLMIFPDSIMSDLKRHCLTLVVGSILYFLLWGYVTSISTNWLTRAIKDWFLYLIVLDIAVMGILYRNYYGRSIINEIGDDDSDKWEYDPNTHRFSKTEYSRAREAFADRIDTLDRAGETLNELEQHKDTLDKTKEKLEEIEQNVNELDAAIRFAPGGDLYKQAEQDFAEQVTNQQANSY